MPGSGRDCLLRRCLFHYGGNAGGGGLRHSAGGLLGPAPLDPDDDRLLRPRVVDAVNDSFGEAALRRFPPHGGKDTIAVMQRLASLLRSPFSFLFARSSTEDRVAAYVIREHGRGRALGEILEDRYVQNRLTPQQRLRLLDRPEVIQALGDETVEDTRRELESARAG